MRLSRRRSVQFAVAFVVTAAILMLLAGAAFAQDNPPPDYRQIAGISSRVAIWIAAEVHLMFAAFVLGVPMFALVVEIIGTRAKDARFDRLAHEFTRLLQVAFSTTATFGAVFVFLLFLLYPRLTSYLADIFKPTLIVYPLLFFGEGRSGRTLSSATQTIRSIFGRGRRGRPPPWNGRDTGQTSSRGRRPRRCRPRLTTPPDAIRSSSAPRWPRVTPRTSRCCPASSSRSPLPPPTAWWVSRPAPARSLRGICSTATSRRPRSTTCGYRLRWSLRRCWNG